MPEMAEGTVAAATIPAAERSGGGVALEWDSDVEACRYPDDRRGVNMETPPPKIYCQEKQNNQKKKQSEGSRISVCHALSLSLSLWLAP